MYGLVYSVHSFVVFCLNSLFFAYIEMKKVKSAQTIHQLYTKKVLFYRDCILPGAIFKPL
jgi:hypothetical protein